MASGQSEGRNAGVKLIQEYKGAAANTNGGQGFAWDCFAAAFVSVGVQSPIETKPPAYGRRAELLLSAELTCAPQERQGVLELTG